MFTQEQLEHINEWKEKADKWDRLEQQVLEYYGHSTDDETQSADLMEIGDITVRAFGFTT